MEETTSTPPKKKEPSGKGWPPVVYGVIGAAMYDTVQGGTLKVLEYNISTDIRRELWSPVPLQGQTVFQKSVAFFQHCRDVEKAMDSNFDGMKYFLEQHGITFEERTMLFDPLDMTVRFAFEFDIPIWFNFTAERVGTGHDIVVEEQSGILREIFTLNSRGTDLHKVQYGHKVPKNIFARCFDSNYIYDVIKDVEFVNETVKNTRLGAQQRIPLSILLDDDVNSGLTRQWTSILSHYSNQHLPGNAYVKIHERLRNTFRLVFAVANNTGAMRSYIAWRTADTLFQTGGQVVEKDTTKDIEDHCLVLVQSMLPHTIGPSVLFKTVNQQRVNAVKNMLHEIVTAIDDSFTRFTFFNNRRDSARRKLSLLKMNIGYNSKFDAPDKVREYYRTLPDLKASFIEDFAKAKRFHSMTYWDHIFRNGVDFINNLYSAQIPVFEANAQYTVRMNLLSIPPAMMYSPLSALGGPTDVNYGALGRLMAHYIMKGFGLYGATACTGLDSMAQEPRRRGSPEKM
ncbi:uncharacterized protein LOC135366223 [Ornithodoros turicata]|uniref:uncharacterized protein LOC135366223 n=1 Tax=Ornithodoros turicata TaxID=34597 RepID=UPI0031396682